MDTQTAQPPPFHYMFDASSHALGTGAPMSVSKYPGAQPEQYRSGYRQFKTVPGRGYVYGPSGNWGGKHYYKYTPIKQHSGASGVLSQIEQPNAYKYKVANLGRLGRIDPQLPRGGSIMRIVGTGGGDDEGDMRAFDSNYDWRNSGQLGPLDLRPATDVGRGDLPVGTNTPSSFPNVGTQTDIQLIGDRSTGANADTQTDGRGGDDAGAQTDMSASDIAELLDLIDELGARAVTLEKNIEKLRAEVRQRPATADAGTQYEDEAAAEAARLAAIQEQVQTLANEYREIYVQMQELIDIPNQTRAIAVKIRRLDNRFQAIRKKLYDLHTEAGYSNMEAQEAVELFERGVRGASTEAEQEAAPQEDIPSDMFREPRSERDAREQSTWLRQQVYNVLAQFLPARRARDVGDRVHNTIMALFARAATATIALAMQRVAALLANRPVNVDQAHWLANQILNYLLGLYNGV